MPRWRVDYRGKKLQRLGEVEADTADDAIEKAAKRFEIDPAQHFNLIVERKSKNKR